MQNRHSLYIYIYQLLSIFLFNHYTNMWILLHFQVTVISQKVAKNTLLLRFIIGEAHILGYGICSLSRPKRVLHKSAIFFVTSVADNGTLACCRKLSLPTSIFRRKSVFSFRWFKMPQSGVHACCCSKLQRQIFFYYLKMVESTSVNFNVRKSHPLLLL